ncbi:RNA-guided endonuclease InsQ/TnpB family protein [Halococcus thailandensis]|uniref:IS1341-type transposase n=1 Tax=Halococcus thailandensis JCM 13552 TaxID=1227457 RepID=M0NDH7_9EURY|nr:RNA-guided endonuclease TnpB family protein [Halococcus thailandensis]EMA54745.1 IS1341-type transposase [Halococcus thailandensis JCM 13552]
MEVRRTGIVKLDVLDERRDDLHTTKEQFLRCANRASEFCWSDRHYDECVTSKAKAERALYDDLKADTDLTANLVQKAIRRAVEAVKSGVDRWKKGRRTNQPQFDSWSVVYDKRSATFSRSEVSLSTVNGRAECEFVFPADSPTPYERYIVNDDYEFRMATLQYDDVTDGFYLHLSTRKYDGVDEADSEASTDTEHQTVLGIDLGVNSLAVASTGTFWQGDDYDHWVREFEKRRAKMQQRETQHGYNALRRLGKRERAWRKQYVHMVANEIVTEATETGCDVIVFEKLDDIRDRLPFAEWHHIWAFRRLYEYVSYKAPEHGVEAKRVPPNHTSQRCSRLGCGFTHEDNRNGTEFCCQNCGYTVNADYNAAKNIGLRYARKRRHRLRSSPKSPNGDAPVDVRINGGTLNGTSRQHVAAE